MILASQGLTMLFSFFILDIEIIMLVATIFKRFLKESGEYPSGLVRLIRERILL